MGRVKSAMVLATRPGAEAVVAGLPLAVRAALALREAGFDDVALVAPDRPRWVAEPLARRAVPVRWASPSAPSAVPTASHHEPTLLLAGDVLVDAAALVGLRDASPGPVWTATGRGVGAVSASGAGATIPDLADRPARASASGTVIRTGLALPLAEAGSPARLEEALLAHLANRARSDSYLAAVLDRPMSRPLTRLLLRTPLTPSHVTLLGILFGLVGAAGLATVSYWGRLGGLLLLVVSLALDCADGDLARARLAQNPTGARLDLVGDYLVNLAVFVGLVTGLLRAGLPPGGGWAALALVAGVGAAMAAVHVLFIRPALEQGGDLHWTGDAWSLRGRPGAEVLEKLASRDYTYLLLVLAIIGRLEWFLYAAAGGAWLFTAGVIGYALTTRSGRGREVARP